MARGRILDEVAGGDGYVLRTREGGRLLLVPLMFLASPTTETLAALARDTTAEYEVRGHAEGAAGGMHFAPARCVMIHRLPR